MPLSPGDLLTIARARVDDATVLLVGGRLDGAAYLCGYSVELALKATICRTLGWAGYPATKKEFEGYLSFKTHDLDVLLHLSGRETFVKTQLLAEWSAVSQWNPESRYQPLGTVLLADAQAMIEAAKKLLGAL